MKLNNNQVYEKNRGENEGFRSIRIRDEDVRGEIHYLILLFSFLTVLAIFPSAAFAEDYYGGIGYLDLSGDSGIGVLPTEEPTGDLTEGVYVLEPYPGFPLSAITGEPPVSRFTTDRLEGPLPLTVRFTDQSTGNPTSWQWDFGDGGTATIPSLSNTYRTAGTYTATLRVTNEQGTDISSVQITVYPAPLPTTTPTPTKSPGIGYLPTPTPDSSLPSIIPTPTMATLKDPIPTIVAPQATFDPGFMNNITPTADFSYIQGDGSSLMSVRFFDSSNGNPTSWEWEFGDGTTSKKQNPVHTYGKSGSYWVFLDVSNDFGIDQKGIDLVVIDKPAQPEAKFIAEPEAGPAPLTVQFSDMSAYGPTGYLWNFADGTTSTLRNPVHTFSQEGSYFVTLTVSNTSPFTKKEVSTDYIKEIIVTGPVEASFTASPDEGKIPFDVTFTDTSVGNPTVWLWEFGDGATSTKQNPVHTYSVLNTRGYTVTLTIDTPGGTDVATGKIATLSSEPPVASFIAFSYNDNLPITYGFQDQSTNAPDSWFWEFGDGEKSFDQNPVHTYLKDGDYSVNLTAGNPSGTGSYTSVVKVRSSKG